MLKVKDIILVALFAGIISILSILSIPTVSGVPFTLQTFAISFCGYTLGSKLGTLSTLAYIILGIIGLPVFSNMSSGIAHIMGLTGGFIYGFIFLSFFCGIYHKKNYLLKAILGIVGLLICHFLGVIQFSFVSKNSLLSSFTIASFPYLLKDIISIFLAIFVSNYIKKLVKI